MLGLVCKYWWIIRGIKEISWKHLESNRHPLHAASEEGYAVYSPTATDQ